MAQTKVSDNVVSINANIDPNAPTGPVLKMVNGQPMVSSRQVADHFGRQHNNVIRSIEAIVRNAPESFGALNFERTSYQVEIPNGGGFKDCPAYLLTRDGFVIVAMGFTGPKAIKWKIAYIQAFNAMEAEISGKTPPPPLPAGTITPVQQQELKELVQAKASAFPDGLKRRVFGQIWSRFQRKFKVPRYDELPAALFSEGRDYIINMNLNGADPLPANPTKQDKLEHNINFWANAYTRLPQREEYWEALQRRAGLAMDTFIKELEAVRADALMPFKEDRNWGVASPFDFLLDPLKAMFDHGVEDIRPIYRLFYEGIQGFKWASSILTSCSK